MNITLRLFVALVLAAFLNTSAQETACLPLPDGLVGWWTGDRHGRDFSGHANHANLAGIAYSDSAKVGPGFDFNGTSTAITVPPSPDLNVNSLTFAAWIHPRTAEYRPILMYERPSAFSSALFWTGGGSGNPDPGAGSLYANLREAPGKEQVIHAPGVIAVDQWSFVAVTYDRATALARLYVNGQVVAEVTTPGYNPDTGAPLHIGYSPQTGMDITRGRHFDGIIDEVQVYNRALSSEELNAIYSADSAGLCRSLTPVTLTQPTATFSQTDLGEFPIAHAADGILDGPGSWGIHPEIVNQTAVFETESDAGFQGGTVLNFDLHFNNPSVEGTTSHTLGRFRISATTDPRDEFADGLPTGGDVTANWTDLQIISAIAKSGATLTALQDNSILVSGTLPRLDTYSISTATRLTGITGFRLEVLEDPSLPHDGPGREPLNGNFALSEFLVSARPGGAPAITDEPDSATASPGTFASFTVEAQSSLPVTYQWFLNGEALLDATNQTYSIDSIDFQHAGTYTARASNVEGSTLSIGAVLNVVPADTSEFAAISLSNQQPADAPITDIETNLLSGPAFFARAYAGPTANSLVAQGPVVPFLTGANSGYFHPIDLILTNVSPGANAFVQIRVWESAASSFEQAVADGLQHGASAILQSPTGGGGNPPHPVDALTPFSLVMAPQFLSQPADLSTLVGATATFQVDVRGSQPISYFWFQRNNSLLGVNTPVLTLTNVTVADSGQIYVIVSNSVAHSTSTVATLLVQVPDTSPPQITLATESPLTTYESQITLTGSITDDRALDSATWQRNSGVPSLILLDHSQFTLTNVVLLRGTNIIRIIARDTAGNTATNELVVNSLAPRSFYITPLPRHQEGSFVEVPIYLGNRGGIGGAAFRLEPSLQLFADPTIRWEPALQGAITQFSTNNFGHIQASFALSGNALPTGEVHIATISMRARSVSTSANTPLRLVLTSLFDPAGNQISTATFEVRSASVLITSRIIIGDNNANHRLDVGDASTMMRYDNLLEPLRAWDTVKNDLNANQDIDSGDILKVLRTVVGLDAPPVLPPGTVPVQNRLSPARINLILDNADAAPGEQVKLTLQLTDNQAPVAAASFRIQYPTNALRLANSAHTLGPIVRSGAAALWNLAPDQNNYVTQNGTISLAVSADRPWPTNNGVLAELTFMVQPGASAQSNWPISLSNAEISTGYNLELIPPVQVTFSGRESLPAQFSANPVITAQGVSLSFTAEPGLRFRLEYSDDLSTWTSLTTITATGEPITHTAPFNPDHPHRFYRAVLTE